MATAAINKGATLAQLQEKVCEHDRFIDGNGMPGAKVRIALLEDGVDRIETSITRMTNWFIGLIITIGGSVAIWFITQQLPKITAIK